MELKPAVRLALAYAYATGYLPRKIHTSTWAEANGLLEGPLLRRAPRADVLDQVRADPLAMAHEYLIGLGYRVDSSGRQGRRTSHYVSYNHPDRSDEALAGRGGSVTLITVNSERPYRVSTGIAAEHVAAAVRA